MQIFIQNITISAHSQHIQHYLCYVKCVESKFSSESFVATAADRSEVTTMSGSATYMCDVLQ